MCHSGRVVRMSVGIGPSAAGAPKRRDMAGTTGAASRLGVSTGRSNGRPVDDGAGGQSGSKVPAGAGDSGVPVSPVVEALRAVAADERVRAAETAVREACAELRWNEALRRRWREARAEAWRGQWSPPRCCVSTWPPPP